MLKLPRKLRLLRVKLGLKNPEIAQKLGVSLQSVVNWASEKRCPAKLDIYNATRLVEISKGLITFKDCGHENTPLSK